MYSEVLNNWNVKTVEIKIRNSKPYSLFIVGSPCILKGGGLKS